MNEHPILFSKDMLRAILDGRKTQTRRVIKLPGWSTGDWNDFEIDDDGTPMVISKNSGCLAAISCPYCLPGDRLWIKEALSVQKSATRSEIECGHFCYKLDDEQGIWISENGYRTISGRFMPRWASRILLKVVQVRVEQIQDIAKDENINDIFEEGLPKDRYTECVEDEPCDLNTEEALFDFQELWNSINAKRGYGWEANPWVWVVKFRVM